MVKSKCSGGEGSCASLSRHPKCQVSEMGHLFISCGGLSFAPKTEIRGFQYIFYVLRSRRTIMYSRLKKRIFNSSRVTRLSIRITLLVVAIWCLSLFFLNRNATYFLWFVSDVESLRVLLGSIFQGLASFFAIVISVSFLVVQLAHGSSSPRLIPNFLGSRSFLIVIFLFLGALSLNLFLLSFLSEQTIRNLFPLVILDLVTSLVALISVIPASFVLLSFAHPVKIGVELIDKFNDEYFRGIPYNTETSPNDGSLPPLQSLIVKSIRDADTDYAQRLLGSFEERIVTHLNDDNAVLYSSYFDSFFKKVSSVASEENEESILQQIIYINEGLEKKVSKSKKYLSSSDTRYEGSFARNILSIINLSVEKNHNRVLWKACGAMSRLREIIVQSIPPDEEIASFRTIKHFRDEGKGEIKNTHLHYTNEMIFEYIKEVYFESNSSIALKALQARNQEVARYFVREIFRTRYDLNKLDQSKYMEVVSRIAFSDFYNLSSLSHLSVKSNFSVSDEVAVGIQEAIDFFLEVDKTLAESYVDLLGQLMIETTEREVLNSDPNAMFYWAGVTLRMLMWRGKNIPALSIKLLDYFEKVLKIISEKQKTSSSPILQRNKETIYKEVASVRNYKEEGADMLILQRAEEILAKYSDANLKE